MKTSTPHYVVVFQIPSEYSDKARQLGYCVDAQNSLFILDSPNIPSLSSRLDKSGIPFYSACLYTPVTP